MLHQFWMETLSWDHSCNCCAAFSSKKIWEAREYANSYGVFEALLSQQSASIIGCIGEKNLQYIVYYKNMGYPSAK